MKAYKTILKLLSLIFVCSLFLAACEFADAFDESSGYEGSEPAAVTKAAADEAKKKEEEAAKKAKKTLTSFECVGSDVVEIQMAKEGDAAAEPIPPLEGVNVAAVKLDDTTVSVEMANIKDVGDLTFILQEDASAETKVYKLCDIKATTDDQGTIEVIGGIIVIAGEIIDVIDAILDLDVKKDEAIVTLAAEIEAPVQSYEAETIAE